MERDMELVRKILFEIESKYISTALMNLKIEGYDMETVAYHCNIMYEAGLISSYKGYYSGDGLHAFSAGHLTWEGHDFIDKIRSDTIWNKVKSTIKKKKLPMILETIKAIATAIISAMTEGAIKGLKGGN